MKNTIIALAVLSVLAGCASYPATRDTPEGTIEMLKGSVVSGRLQEEWDILSPDLKRRISDQAGRNVDYADYVTVRNAYRADPQVRNAEKLLGLATVRTVQPDGANAAYVTVGAMNQSARIRMIKLDKWELLVQGDDQPYDGIVGDQLMGVNREADGSYTVWMRDPGTRQISWQQTFPQSEVTSYGVVTKWYVDDLGDLEQQLFG